MSRKRTPARRAQIAVKRSPLDRPDHSMVILRYEGRRNEHEPWIPQQSQPAMPESEVWTLYQQIVESIAEKGELYVRNPHVVRVDLYETRLTPVPSAALEYVTRGINSLDMIEIDGEPV